MEFREIILAAEKKNSQIIIRDKTGIQKKKQKNDGRGFGGVLKSLTRYKC